MSTHHCNADKRTFIAMQAGNHVICCHAGRGLPVDIRDNVTADDFSRHGCRASGNNPRNPHPFTVIGFQNKTHPACHRGILC
jgi:hypothetical protein